MHIQPFAPRLVAVVVTLCLVACFPGPLPLDDVDAETADAASDADTANDDATATDVDAADSEVDSVDATTLDVDVVSDVADTSDALDTSDAIDADDVDATTCPEPCDDHDQCTADTCLDGQCYHSESAMNGKPCSDGSACTDGDLCQSGACIPGDAKLCVAPDDCHVAGACDPESGLCGAATTRDDDEPCDDGDDCTENDKCASGACFGSAKSCDDGRGCTLDACEEGTCQHDTSACDCLLDSQCDDGKSCTDDACGKVDGKCAHTVREGDTCSDGSACTLGDACAADGSCHGTARVCDDGDACTTDTCNPGSGQCGSMAKAEGAACIEPDHPGVCTDTECRGVSAVTAGDEHTCAILEDGGVTCWGANDLGQLGVPGDVAIGDGVVAAGGPEMPPRRVPLDEKVMALAAGFGHTCALTVTGVVRCWGDGQVGQLGSGSPDSIGLVEGDVPSTVDLGERVQSISAGYGHTCAVLESGAVKCWGWNLRGQLGVGSTQNLGAGQGSWPPPSVPLGAAASFVAAGTANTCAIVGAGDVKCWGDGGPQVGATGVGPAVCSTPGNCSPVKVALTWLADRVAVGSQFACALSSLEGVSCWGNAPQVLLGGGGESDPTPVSINVGPGYLRDIEVAGNGYACVRFDDGAVACWGNGFGGALGIGSSQDVATEDAMPPQPVILGGPAIALSVGERHACAQVAGSVRCWGAGEKGALGYESIGNVGETPTSLPPPDVNVIGAPGSHCTFDTQCASATCTIPGGATSGTCSL